MSPTRAVIGRRATSRRHAVWLVCLLGITAGCSAAIDPTPPAPEPEPVSTPPAPQPEPGAGRGSSFPECAGATYDFVGQSTLAALNIQGHVPAQLPEPGRPAMIWVTHDLRPHDFGPPGGPVLMTRMLCFEFADGTGGSGWPVDEAWRPPGQ
jgi:hypothetical protein